MSIRAFCHQTKFNLLNFIFRSSFLYSKYLGDDQNFNPDLLREIKSNVVLKSKNEIEEHTDIIRKLGFPERSDKSKNWDTLIAYSEIIKNSAKESYILDAGSEVYSMILPWLFLSGFRNLFGINLVFSSKFKRGTIKYNYGDITATEFESNTFDAITCLSVIEHGVDLEKLFKEMNRILRINGILVLSTDYYETTIDSNGKHEYGHQIKIFNKEELRDLIQIARKNNFQITSEIDLNCNEKAVRWEKFDLDYTFICLSFRKVNKK